MNAPERKLELKDGDVFAVSGHPDRRFVIADARRGLAYDHGIGVQRLILADGTELKIVQPS